MSSSNNIVPPKGKYTRRMAAEEIGRSSDTLRRWQREGLCEPSSSMQAGQLTVWLYTKRDLKRLEKIAASQRPGRKPGSKNKPKPKVAV